MVGRRSGRLAQSNQMWLLLHPPRAAMQRGGEHRASPLLVRSLVCVCMSLLAGLTCPAGGRGLGGRGKRVERRPASELSGARTACNAAHRLLAHRTSGPSPPPQPAAALTKLGKHSSNLFLGCLLSLCSLSLASVELHMKALRQMLQMMDIALALTSSWLLPPAGRARRQVGAVRQREGRLPRRWRGSAPTRRQLNHRQRCPAHLPAPWPSPASWPAPWPSSGRCLHSSGHHARASARARAAAAGGCSSGGGGQG